MGDLKTTTYGVKCTSQSHSLPAYRRSTRHGSLLPFHHQLRPAALRPRSRCATANLPDGVGRACAGRCSPSRCDALCNGTRHKIAVWIVEHIGVGDGCYGCVSFRLPDPVALRSRKGCDHWLSNTRKRQEG